MILLSRRPVLQHLARLNVRPSRPPWQVQLCLFDIVLNLRASTYRFHRTLPAVKNTRRRVFGTWPKTGPPRPAAVGLGHPTWLLPDSRAPFSAVRTPATDAWAGLPSGQIRPRSPPDCISVRHDGRKSKYAAPGFRFEHAVAPWPHGPWPHGPWPHGTNKSKSPAEAHASLNSILLDR